MSGTATATSSGDELHELVEARLRRADQRYTPGRRAIIDLLIRERNPVSIEDIAHHLPKLPRSSAYRNLVDLEGAGLVRRVAAHDEFARFELAEDLTEHHHHLLCISCGKVTDFAFSPKMEHDLAGAIDHVAASERFSPQGHRIDVLGTCGECAT
jgi:Fe2+ or Zn2+ uptake regulation protein